MSDPQNPLFPMYTAEELTKALNDMPGLWLAVGTLRAKFRRCKPGSKMHKETEALMTKMENEAMELSAMIRMDIYMRKNIPHSPV